MSDTPRTDAVIETYFDSGCYGELGEAVRAVPVEFARELERALSKGSKWIPVSERLPGSEWHGAVLAAHGRSVFIESTHPSWWNKLDEQRRGKEFDGPTVTHWMPLPSAPEASK